MFYISILGDFDSSIFPLYNHFKHKIKTHLIVHDESFANTKKYQYLLNSLHTFNKQHGLSVSTQLYTLNEDSQASINRLTASIKSMNADLHNVYINTTDGLSNISLLLSAHLLKKGVNFLSYDMYENSYNLLTQEKIKTKKISSSLNISEHFALKNIDIVSCQDKLFAEKNSKLIIKLFEHHNDELELMKKDIAHCTKKSKSRYSNAYKIVEKLGLDMYTNPKEISGGLFEYYVYLLIKDLGFHDIQIGVTINQKLGKKVFIKNEFDILLMHNNHLHMIECKYTKNINLASLVYKYAALIHLIDDEGKIIILTNKSKKYAYNIYDPKESKIDSQRRAALNNIALRGSVVKNKALFLEDVKSLL